MLKKTRVAAFTLMECLLALLVLSGSLLVFDGLTKLVSQEVRHQTSSVDKDWLVFAEQLRTEFDGVSLLKVENNRIYVDKDGQLLAFGKSKGDDFRKTNDKGQGYQPMLYHLQSVQISQSDGLVRIDLTFQNGKRRTFLYDFTEAS